MTVHVQQPAVFIAGSRGMLALDLSAALTARGISVSGADLPELDITSDTSVAAAVGSQPYTALINCAAYTAVDKAETDRDAAFAVNGDGPGVLARACAERNLPLIHISTDFVFDGALDRPYREDDETYPLGVYGASKLKGELAVREVWDRHLIVRTAWLYGINGGNFPKTMLRLAREREELRVINDQTGSPTWTGDLAGALAEMVTHIAGGMAGDVWGTYHFCGSGMTTWHGFAEAVIEEVRHYEELAVKRIVPIPTEEYPTPAARPKWSVLDTGKITHAFGITPPTWRESLRQMIGELYRQKPQAM